MVHYLYFFQVFLLNVLIHAYTFPDTDLNKGVSQIVRRNSVKNDSVFVDVLKNITRVNGVLEDLILNYEKLQKIYKSQESLTELSSEDDADGRFKYNKKPRASLVQTSKPTFYSTQMFFSEEEHSLVDTKPEDEQSVEDIKKHEEEKSVEDNKKPQEKQSVEDNKKAEEEQSVEDNKKTQEEQSLEDNKTPQVKQSAEDNKKPQEKQSAEDNKKPQEEQTVGDNKKSQVMQIVIKDYNTTNEKYLKKLNNKNKEAKKEQSVTYEDSSEVSETDYEQETETSSSYENYEEILAKKITNNNKNIPNEKDKRIKILNNKTVKAAMTVTVEIPTAHLEPLKSIPDREKKPTFQEPLKDTKKPNEMTTQKTQPHTFKKTIIKTEEFRNKAIWDTISENKPVHLKTEREIIYSKRLGHDGTVFGRKSDKGPSLLKSTSEEKMDIKKKEGKELSSASVENDKLISKEQFKTRILRKAYGDACLKLVVRKCYKACKEASRKACLERRCQRITKEEFKRHSKTGCIKEFEAKSASLRKVGDGKEIEEKIPDDFHDIKKNGYLAAVCLPPLRSNDSDNATQMGNTTLAKMSGETIELNILRERYEKACRKSSRRKCLAACQYAIGKTYTSVHTYDSKQKIAFEKYCKRECHSAYRGYDSKKDTKLSTESSGSSSSESDSKSDDDSSDSDSSDSYSDEKKNRLKQTKTKAKTSKSSKHKKKTTTTEAPDDATDSSDSGGTSNSDEKKNLSKQTNAKEKTSKGKKVKKSTSSKHKKKTKPTEAPNDSTDSSDSGDNRML